MKRAIAVMMLVVGTILCDCSAGSNTPRPAPPSPQIDARPMQPQF